MKGIIGKKLGMTQVFLEDGSCVGVTVVEAGPCKVSQVRTEEVDGYSAVQLSYGSKKEKNATKPEIGHYGKAGVAVAAIAKEFAADGETLELGADVTVSIFDGVGNVTVHAVSKGRGFAGTIKRHNFRRGRETHGNVNHRAPGSAGSHTYPARTFPGKKFAGQYGNQNCTVRNLSLVRVDAERNLLFIKGAVPGPINGTVFVEKY
jgi:large subunit ribosomal protein L3